MQAVWIALGGAVGTLLRFGVSRLAVACCDVRWPLGTTIVNVIGSFFLALLLKWSELRPGFPDGLRTVLAVGLLGGFTTYSSFNEETFRMIERRQLGLAASYLAVTILGCLGAGLCGRALALRMGQA